MCIRDSYKSTGLVSGAQLTESEVEFSVDLNGDGAIGEVAAVDRDGNKLVDNSADYKIYVSGGESLKITGWSGVGYSDASSRDWNAIKAVSFQYQKSDGSEEERYKVLLEGEGRKSSQYGIWEVNQQGLIYKSTGLVSGCLLYTSPSPRD